MRFLRCFWCSGGLIKVKLLQVKVALWQLCVDRQNLIFTPQAEFFCCCILAVLKGKHVFPPIETLIVVCCFAQIQIGRFPSLCTVNYQIEQCWCHDVDASEQFLSRLDTFWQQHLKNMDFMKRGAPAGTCRHQAPGGFFAKPRRAFRTGMTLRAYGRGTRLGFVGEVKWQLVSRMRSC